MNKKVSLNYVSNFKFMKTRIIQSKMLGKLIFNKHLAFSLLQSSLREKLGMNYPLSIKNIPLTSYKAYIFIECFKAEARTP